MFHRFLGLVVICFATILFSTGCDPYAKLAKSRKISDKDSVAYLYYKKKNYEQAGLIFQDLLGIYRGDYRYKRTLYHFAYCKYYLGEYSFAAEFFRQFETAYPGDELTEECAFMKALCHSKLSDTYDLDQSETVKAIEEYQLFVTQYPLSSRVKEANEQIQQLRSKLAEKSFKQADLYLKISYYKAATIAFKNTIQEFPDSKFKEEAYFKMFKASYLYAANSITSKQEERYQEAISFYLKFIDKFPNSEYKSEAENLYDKTIKALEKLKSNPGKSS
ncbi:MAG: outer membrane protein assembly factor BamD [Bacteroidia bacterium]|nr:outer membrane protein assembly factor BamD [Bacteroidia bacterium]